MSNNSREVLVLGAEGAGKTLLMRRIKETSRGLDISSEATIPTVGVDVISLDAGGMPISFREVGATLASRWGTYLPESSALLFVIDISDMGGLASAWALLHEVLSIDGSHTSGKPFGIVLNKADSVDATTRSMAENILRLDELLLRMPSIVLFTGDSLGVILSTKVLNWLSTACFDTFVS
eukprot:gene4947-9889_t